MTEQIQALTMPKWGMTMTEGTFLSWLMDEGAQIKEGDEVAEVETDKMTGPVEVHMTGTLRRHVAADGEVIAVGGLLAVVAPDDVPDETIQAFIDEFQAALPAVSAVESSGPESVSVAGALGDLHVLAQGDGPEAVVLLHGFGGDALNFRFNIEPIAALLPIVAIDLPGHGSSAKNVGAGDLEAFTASVVEVMDARGLTRVHLVGHSLGGLVAAKVALDEPARVASLAVIAPAGFGEEINAAFVDGYVSAASRREVKPVLQALFADPSLVSRQLVEEVLKYKRLEGVPESLATVRGALFPEGRQTEIVAERLGAVDVPLLVVWGSEDRVIDASQASAAPGGAHVEVIDAVGHSPHVEAPEAVNALLLEHLRPFASA